MDESLLPTHTTRAHTYDELCCRRKEIEAELNMQEQRLIGAAQQLIKPQNIVRTISSVVFDNVTNGFSLFEMFNQGWRWVQLAIRLIKRFT